MSVKTIVEMQTVCGEYTAQYSLNKKSGHVTLKVKDNEKNKVLLVLAFSKDDFAEMISEL